MGGLKVKVAGFSAADQMCSGMIRKEPKIRTPKFSTMKRGSGAFRVKRTVRSSIFSTLATWPRIVANLAGVQLLVVHCHLRGENDVIGVESLAVGPRHALAQRHGKLGGVRIGLETRGKPRVQLAGAVVENEKRFPHGLMRSMHAPDAGAVGHPVEVLGIADGAVEIEDHRVLARHVLRARGPGQGKRHRRGGHQHLCHACHCG